MGYGESVFTTTCTEDHTYDGIYSLVCEIDSSKWSYHFFEIILGSTFGPVKFLLDNSDATCYLYGWLVTPRVHVHSGVKRSS